LLIHCCDAWVFHIHLLLLLVLLLLLLWWG
jgi:hypothetical protein